MHREVDMIRPQVNYVESGGHHERGLEWRAISSV